MSDIVHLILCLGETLDWERLVTRVGEHWPLLLSQVLMFNYVYPGYRSNVPPWVPERLLERAAGSTRPRRRAARSHARPLISRFSFMIDVREWGFHDPGRNWSRRAAAARDPRHRRGRRLARARRERRRILSRRRSVRSSAT
jgi:hypothetical protein